MTSSELPNGSDVFQLSKKVDRMKSGDYILASGCGGAVREAS